MDRQETMGILLVIAATLVIGGGSLFYYLLPSGPYTIEILARAPERGNWFPSEIEIKRGDRPVRLIIRNVDGVTHGFALPAFNIRVDQIRAGQTAQVSFIPSRVGSFRFYCTVWCGPYHMKMIGILKIKGEGKR